MKIYKKVEVRKMVRIIKEDETRVNIYRAFDKIWKQVREIMQQLKQIKYYNDDDKEYIKIMVIDISRLLEDVSNTLKEKIKEINAKK